jgi:hypothetical protein
MPPVRAEYDSPEVHAAINSSTFGYHYG